MTDHPIESDNNRRQVLPPKFQDEVEIVTNKGESDECTPSVLSLYIADELRSLEAWQQAKPSPRQMGKADQLLSSDSFRLAMAIATLASSEYATKKAISLMAAAFLQLEEIGKEHPAATERMGSVVDRILSAGYEVIKDLRLADHSRQTRTMRPLAINNAAHNEKVNRAQVIAVEIWQADSSREYRLLDMAKLIKSILEREGFEKLPTPERIKDWIRPVAPVYAKRSGRGKK